MSSIADVASEFEARQQRRTCIRFLMSAGVAFHNNRDPLTVFEELHPRSVHLDAVRRQLDIQRRGAVPGGASDSWGSGLIGPKVFTDAFAVAIRQRQVLGRLPGAVQLPPSTRAPCPSNPATAGWIGAGEAIPVSKGGFANMFLRPLLLGGIVVVTDELLTASGPASEAVFEVLLTNAAVIAADTALLDPAQIGEPDVSPPSLTAGAYSVASSGPSLAALNADLGAVADHMQAQGVPLAQPVVIMSPASALRAGGLSLPGGQFTVPVVTSPSARDEVVLLDAGLLAYTDGGLDIVPSNEATVAMSDAPAGDISTPAAPTTMVSLWQVDSTGFKLNQYLNWQLTHPAAVGVVTGYGAGP